MPYGLVMGSLFCFLLGGYYRPMGVRLMGKKEEKLGWISSDLPRLYRGSIATVLLIYTKKKEKEK
jgi:hypothetical protein